METNAYRIADPAEAHAFGELWIDRGAEVSARIGDMDTDLRAQIQTFIETGYVVFEGAVSEDVVDQILADKDRIYTAPEDFILKKQGKYIDPTGLEHLDAGHRVVDLYAVSKAARDAIAAPRITQFLQAVFEDSPIAMQSIYFEYGSQQSLHQDTAYVISEKPMSLAAAWIALEDIKEGSGELIYLPRSHRFDHFLFSGAHKNWTPNRDGTDQHAAFLSSLVSRGKEQGLSQERFLARKGDVLIWHADLAHGGARIVTPNQTRMSLVAHYCPQSVKATYRQHIEDTYLEVGHETGMYFTSRHYDLASIARGEPRGSLLFDGGVTKARLAAGSGADLTA